MKFAETIFKNLIDKRAIMGEHNGIYIPQTLPGIEKSWWRKLKNPFIKAETKLENVNEAIAAHEVQIDKAKAFVEQNKESELKAVATFVDKRSVKTLEENLKRLQAEKIKLEKKTEEKAPKFVKVKEEDILPFYKEKYGLSTKEIAKALIENNGEKSVDDALTETTANKLGLSVEDFKKLGEDLTKKDQMGDIKPNIESPMPDIKTSYSHDNGGDLATGLASQVQDAMKDNDPKPIEELISNLQTTKQNAAKMEEVLEELAKEKLHNEELEKRVKEVETIEKERDELRYSNKTYKDTVDRMDGEIAAHLEKIKDLETKNGDLTNEKNGNLAKANEAEQKQKDAENRAQAAEQKLTASENEKNSTLAMARSLAEKISQIGAAQNWDLARYFPEVAALTANQPQDVQQQVK
jgi:chromosome segregation ATPase